MLLHIAEFSNLKQDNIPLYVYDIFFICSSVDRCFSCLCTCIKSLLLYPTFFDRVGHSPSVSPVHGILQARILEWVAVHSSRGSSDPGIEPMSLITPTLAGGFFTTSTTWEAPKSELGRVCLFLSKLSWGSFRKPLTLNLPVVPEVEKDGSAHLWVPFSLRGVLRGPCISCLEVLLWDFPCEVAL